MHTHADYITEIQSMIKDDAGKLSANPGGDLSRVLSKAVSDYSAARPLIIRKKVTGNGTDSYGVATILGELWKHGYSAIRGIEYPIGQKPVYMLDRSAYDLYDDGSAQDGSNIALRLDSLTISSTESFVVEFTSPMSVAESGSQNFPDTDENFSNITTLASAYACQRLAAAYAQSVDASISADTVNYNDKSSKYQTLARQYMRQYNLAVYGSEDPVVSVGAAIESRTIERRGSEGTRYLFHRGS